MRILWTHKGLLNAIVPEDIRAIDEADDRITGRNVLGGCAHLVGQRHAIGELRRVLTVVTGSPCVQANGKQRLVCVLARRNRDGVSDSHLAVDVREILKRVDFDVRAFGLGDHEVIHEHVEARVVVDQARLNGVIHGAG